MIKWLLIINIALSMAGPTVQLFEQLLSLLKKVRQYRLLSRMQDSLSELLPLTHFRCIPSIVSKILSVFVFLSGIPVSISCFVLAIVVCIPLQPQNIESISIKLVIAVLFTVEGYIFLWVADRTYYSLKSGV